MDGFDEIQAVLDRHARRMADQVGRLLVDIGRTLQEQVKERPESERPEPTRDDLYRDAARLGVKGRSTMTKEELRRAVQRARGL